MEKINAVITGVGGYVPDYILTNEEISKMVDTNDEWIMTRIERTGRTFHASACRGKTKWRFRRRRLDPGMHHQYPG